MQRHPAKELPEHSQEAVQVRGTGQVHQGAQSCLQTSPDQELQERSQRGPKRRLWDCGVGEMLLRREQELQGTIIIIISTIIIIVIINCRRFQSSSVQLSRLRNAPPSRKNNVETSQSSLAGNINDLD